MHKPIIQGSVAWQDLYDQGYVVVKKDEYMSHWPTQRWQPIETAPKDGSAILIWPAESAFTRRKNHFISYVVRWNDLEEGWIEASGEEYDRFCPTHWMPLPEPPK